MSTVALASPVMLIRSTAAVPPDRDYRSYFTIPILSRLSISVSNAIPKPVPVLIPISTPNLNAQSQPLTMKNQGPFLPDALIEVEQTKRDRI